MKKLLLLILISASAVGVGMAQQANYLVTAGNGNGIKFWSDDAYKIHMGAAPEYYYGPVTDYSIKTNMSSGTPGRGWTWGVIGQTPVAAINASTGHMQIAGFFNAQGINLDRSSWPFIQFSENGTLGARIQGTGGMFAVTSTNGASNWLTVNSTSGNVGIGTSSPQSKLDVVGTFTSGNAKILATDASWQEGVAIIKPAGWGGIRILRSDPSGSVFNGNWAVGYNMSTGNDLNFATVYNNVQYDVLHLSNSTRFVGIGTTAPSAKLHINISGSNTNYAAYSGADVGLILQNGNSTTNNLNLLAFTDASGWGVADLGTITNHGNHSAKLFFSTRPAGSGPLQRMIIDENGNVGIGSLNPNQKLTVNGTIYGKEVKVDLSVPGPDYVFLNTYSLRSLAEVEDYIKSNQHLPEVPSAAQMEKEGINLSEMNMLLLKKVEEVTLYLIELKKENNLLRERVGVLESKASGNK